MIKDDFLKKCKLGTVVIEPGTRKKYEVTDMTWGGKIFAKPVESIEFDYAQVNIVEEED